MIEHTVPTSFFDAAAKNEVLQIVFFAIIFAVALSKVQGPSKTFMLSACESLSEVMFKFVNIVMAYAPIGIGAAIAVTVSKGGLGVLRNLGILVGTLYGALIVFVLFVFVPIALMFRVPLKRFVRAVREPWLIAFTTASSEAAFPLAMERMEQLGVPRRIVAFVLPTGYSFNLDGSTLYLALASVFAAQAAGIDMPISTAARDDADADAHQQRRGGRAAGVAGHPVGRPGTVRLAFAGGRRHSRRGRVDGHGAHVAQRRRQLPGDGRDGAVGRRVRQAPATPAIDVVGERCEFRSRTPLGSSSHPLRASERGIC